MFSASQDIRFSPIELYELSSLRVDVSLLVSFEVARDYKDWIIGEHGIVMEVQHEGKLYKSTFLPEIPVEQSAANSVYSGF